MMLSDRELWMMVGCAALFLVLFVAWLFDSFVRQH
jgi:hypothetical protein